MFSVAMTVSLIFLMTAVIIPGVMAGSPVDLGSAGNFVILTKSGITTTGTTRITGNIGSSPIAATGMTGFGLVMDASNRFSKSSLVTGNVYAANYANPTPSTLTTAVSDMERAYTSAAGRAAGVTELGAGNIGGKTLAPGVYKWSSPVIIPTDVTLAGTSNDIWIFEIAQTLDISSGTQVILKGGAQPKNIFWQVAGKTTLGTGSVFNGNILDKTAIVMNTGATLHGRALAQTAVTLDANTVTAPASTSLAPPTPAGTAGKTVTVNVGGNSGVYKTAVTGKGINSLIVTGTAVSGPGKNIAPAPGNVYQYLDLVPAQYTTIDREVISFTVPLAWLNSNHVAPGSVVLYRIEGTSWKPQPATFVKTVASRDYFTAPGTGFSRFAIAG
jgi:hypothetical protein